MRGREHQREQLATELRSRLIERRRAEAARGAEPSAPLEVEVRSLVDEDAALLGAADRDALVAGILRDTVGLGPLEDLLADPAVEEVMVNGAASVFVELKGSLDEIWGIEPPKGLAIIIFLRTQLHSFGLVLVLAFLLLVSLVFSAALSVLQRYAGGISSSSYDIFAILSSMIAFGVIACLFAVIYKVLPDAPLSWRDVWIGAAFTAGLFSLGKFVIGLYLGNSSVASSFGAAGSLIALLLWVYYSAQIFFLGAEFTRQYALGFGSLRQEPNTAFDRIESLNPAGELPGHSPSGQI